MTRQATHAPGILAEHAASMKRAKPRLEGERAQAIEDQRSAGGEWHRELGRRIADLSRVIAMCGAPCTCEGCRDARSRQANP